MEWKTTGWNIRPPASNESPETSLETTAAMFLYKNMTIKRKFQLSKTIHCIKYRSINPNFPLESPRCLVQKTALSTSRDHHEITSRRTYFIFREISHIFTYLQIQDLGVESRITLIYN